MRCKVAALWTQKVFRVIAVATWLYSTPLMGLVTANAGLAWGLFSGFVVAPSFAAMIGVLATDKVNRPLAIDWETEVFQRKATPVPAQGQNIAEKELLAA